MFALTQRRFIPELKRSLRGCRPNLSLALCLFEEGYSLDFFGFLIPLLFLDRWRYDPHEIMERWGFYYHERSWVWCWGDRTRFWHMPWTLDHIKCEVLRPDGAWVQRAETRWNPETQGIEKDQPDGRWIDTYPYHYTLRSGEVQKRLATIYVERREWRQRWLKWCPLFARKRQYIDVAFNDEVGDETGSWKGGTLGCGYEMRKHESPLQTLRRMERERKFR